MRRTPRLFFAAAAAAFLFAACGDATDEARFAEAAEALSEARDAVTEAQFVVDEKQAAVDLAQGELEIAQEKLAAAQSVLSEAEGEVDVSATDAVLFRAVQSALLQDDQLADVAISAQVTDGTVLLLGSVPNAELRNHAVEVAQATLGVTRVESRIEVEAAEPVSADAPAEDAATAPAE